MAGHSKFANIKHRKGAQDAKRAKVFTKLVREIITAVKVSGNDPNMNPRLRVAINAARQQNLPKDRIESAINRGSSSEAKDNYEEIRYEGYGPGGIAVIVESLTGNKNRTVAEIRSAFTKSGGTLAETGSVSFMFDNVGLIVYKFTTIEFDQLFESVIEVGADDCINDGKEYYQIICNPSELISIRDQLASKYGEPEDCRLVWRAKNIIEIDNEDKAIKLVRLIENLENNDDVQNVYGNYTISEAILAKISL